uniref:3-ketoacyl-CoA thiolase B n=1 Tax=Rhizophora mucronata TaxID=61149 RepID=A0A2P2ILZ8_RHIMU
MVDGRCVCTNAQANKYCVITKNGSGVGNLGNDQGMQRAKESKLCRKRQGYNQSGFFTQFFQTEKEPPYCRVVRTKSSNYSYGIIW